VKWVKFNPTIIKISWDQDLRMISMIFGFLIGSQLMVKKIWSICSNDWTKGTTGIDGEGDCLGYFDEEFLTVLNKKIVDRLKIDRH
jgi:hypothetical protein